MTNDVYVREVGDHRLLGREVAQLQSGRRGTVGLILEYRTKATGKLIRSVAHMRPLDGSGREWTSDPADLQPIRPTAPDIPERARCADAGALATRGAVNPGLPASIPTAGHQRGGAHA